MSKKMNAPRVCIVTLGCPKNEVDSDIMATDLHDSGYLLVEDPDDADVVIVNTCAFITDATSQSIDTILDLASDEDAKPGRRIVVTGCMPSRYRDELARELPEVSAFLPADDEDRIVETLRDVLDKSPRFRGVSPVPRSQGSYSSYVKISDGCDRFCSYCSIPYIRGRYHSFPYEDIRREIAWLVDGGCREVVLIGQDTGLWGSDFHDGRNLAWLLERLASEFTDTWIRVMYLQPEGLSDELLETMAAHPNICHYFDIPLQHASAKVIREMNRKGDGKSYLEMIERIRKHMPDASIRSTFIAGFPGEDRSDAKALKDFIERAGFDHAGVFIYSQEDITIAGKREDQVPMRTRKARAQRLRDLADQIGFARNATRVGSVLPVLVEGYEQDDGIEELVGRSMYMAPEVDGQVHLPLGSARPGDIVMVELTDSFCYEFEGEVRS
ncbi:MAG: 30S ribosomal protein S12 methylthiotransferase RimO [Coriobacteriales bacterium]|nr:30S ribosomal protein S12 methylthiotransferase RimO [Coriobacteriales bacterium]MBQ6586764.1 30S ribosomal protein S12 methylthiotransferase RimO [Coriobacteriales bacterium]